MDGYGCSFSRNAAAQNAAVEKPMHDLRLLNTFAQAVRSRSFTTAAQVLKCSPGAISKNIARLERDIGVRLFNRTTRQLSLTCEGQQFYDAVTRSLTELERIDDIVAHARGRVEGVVRLAIGAAFGKLQVLPALTRLLDKHRGLTLEVAFSDDPGDLVAHGYDLAVRCGKPDDSRYICRRLCGLPLMLVASPGYVERYGMPTHPSDLDTRECVNNRHGEENCSWIFTPPAGSADEPVRIDPKGRLVITRQVEANVVAAVAGFGPTVIDTYAAQPHLDAGALVQLLPDWRVEASIEGGSDIYLVYPHRDHLPLRVRTTIDFIADECGAGTSHASNIRVPVLSTARAA